MNILGWIANILLIPLYLMALGFGCKFVWSAFMVGWNIW